MSTPFNQTVTCRFGKKPYYDNTISSDWTVDYDGDALSLTSFTGGKTRGGSFSTNGEEPVRENFSGAALLKAFLRANGGEIYFTKTLTGQIISTGHNNFGGTFIDKEIVECGGNIATEWLADPGSSPFSFRNGTMSWTGGSIEMNCAIKAEGGAFGSTIVANMVLIPDGPLDMSIGGNNRLFRLSGYDVPDRTVSIPVDATTTGGVDTTVWQSTANDSSLIRLELLTSNLIRAVSEISPDGKLTRCLPAPLDPRF